MAVTTTSAPQQQTAMPAVDLRQLFGATIAFEGVRGANDLAVAQRAAGANMSVDVGTGSAAIQDDHATGGGYYSYTLAATANYAVSAADGTNPRIDRVVIRVRDQALGDAANDIAPFVVAGTPTSGATLVNLTGAAAVPGSSLLLANVLVPAGSSTVTTANIDTTVRRIVNEPAYVEVTAPVTVSGTSGAQTTVVTAQAVTLDGATSVCVEFGAGQVSTSATLNDVVILDLWDGASDLGQIAIVYNVAAAPTHQPVYPKVRLATPSAGSHTYAVKAYRTTANGTVQAGSGGAITQRPIYIRVTKA